VHYLYHKVGMFIVTYFIVVRCGIRALKKAGK